jgi:hypothetical protein
MAKSMPPPTNMGGVRVLFLTVIRKPLKGELKNSKYQISGNACKPGHPGYQTCSLMVLTTNQLRYPKNAIPIQRVMWHSDTRLEKISRNF